jgi:ATP-dependent DNA helicase RecQ
VTPTEAALRGLLAELLDAGPTFHVSLAELSSRHDIRLLVLRTALTYLELLGALHQGTPFYSAYELRPILTPAEIAGKFDGERAELVAAVFAAARKGRVWYALDPGKVAVALEQTRDRIVRALEYVQQQGWAELRVSEVRQRYRRLRPSEDAEALASELGRRFETRERQELGRIRTTLALVTHDGCQVNALVGYFGETRATPCGHCTHCLTGRAQMLPEVPPRAALPGDLDVGALRALRGDQPVALGGARQVARFLCGMTSPSSSRARLTRHPLFGAVEDRPFAQVLAWCEGIVTTG